MYDELSKNEYYFLDEMEDAATNFCPPPGEEDQYILKKVKYIIPAW